MTKLGENSIKKMQTKQVIVVRKDLNMRKGKIASQAAHASMKHITLAISSLFNFNIVPFIKLMANKEWRNWVTNSFAKITVYVNSEDELMDVLSKGKYNGLLCEIIQDEGRTEFNGVPTYTALAIGPHEVSKINKVTGKLPLY